MLKIERSIKNQFFASIVSSIIFISTSSIAAQLDIPTPLYSNLPGYPPRRTEPVLTMHSRPAVIFERNNIEKRCSVYLSETILQELIDGKVIHEIRRPSVLPLEIENLIEKAARGTLRVESDHPGESRIDLDAIHWNSGCVYQNVILSHDEGRRRTINDSAAAEELISILNSNCMTL